MNTVKICYVPRIFISVFILTLLLAISGCGSGGGGGSGSSGSTSNNSVTLSWNAPTQNSDGTPVTDLAGYKVYYGTSSRSYTEVIDIGNVTTYTIYNLASGTYYFAVTAYDTSGNESGPSNEVTKTIQ